MSKKKESIQPTTLINLKNIDFQAKLDYIQQQLKNKESQTLWKQYQKDVIEKEVTMLNQELEIQSKLQELKLVQTNYPFTNMENQDEQKKIQGYLFDGILCSIADLTLNKHNQDNNQEGKCQNEQQKKKKGRKPGKVGKCGNIEKSKDQSQKGEKEQDKQKEEKNKKKNKGRPKSKINNINQKGIQKGQSKQIKLKPGRKPNKQKVVEGVKNKQKGQIKKVQIKKKIQKKQNKKK
ncbi:unnamed protein product [Paramecium sonneborni]|uniref:Uncharacterized protein n=1 Tax=Paramecium sonneborni TaxID=65129 RepID=A0A8S1QZ65_9CILI|nr:unnamed protein product [Paramecium sonneborni]